MERQPGPGTPVTVVRRGDPPAQWAGEIAAIREGGVAVRVVDGPAEWDAGARYSVVALAEGAKLVLAAAYLARNERAVAFRALGPWQRLEQRRHPRYPVDLRAEVRSVLGNSRQGGRVVDISLGGMAVRVPARPGGRQVRVGVTAGVYSSELLCTMVGTEEQADGVLLRLAFAELLPTQRAFVRQLIAGLEEASRRAAS
ncbi:PilZ domain-containing protein [Tepidiforma sp.]|uniref:PilZ domain-containing protein n=1 Tax=Tepidiforma sp. TaxID=2682230 RepID=UPI002ADDD83D|nr:PilZ domain-containing protein [Tepidiforma sp.]